MVRTDQCTSLDTWILFCQNLGQKNHQPKTFPLFKDDASSFVIVQETLVEKGGGEGDIPQTKLQQISEQFLPLIA